MIRAALELAVLGGFITALMLWADRGAEIVTLMRIGG